jgi:hypothetical protein
MWRNAFVRLLILSFMPFVILGLILEQSDREVKSSKDRHDLVPGKNKGAKEKFG